MSGFASLYPTYQLPLLDFSDIRGKKKTEYFSAVQSGMDRNYEPLRKSLPRGYDVCSEFQGEGKKISVLYESWVCYNVAWKSEEGRNMSVKDLIKEEVDRLPENALAEVLDFIQFLELKAERDIFVKASQKLSERSFDKIWSNQEDAVYDNL